MLSSPDGEAEALVFPPARVVGEVEDVLPRGGQVGTDGEVLGVLEEALAEGIFAEAVWGGSALAASMQ